MANDDNPVNVFAITEDIKRIKAQVEQLGRLAGNMEYYNAKIEAIDNQRKLNNVPFTQITIGGNNHINIENRSETGLRLQAKLEDAIKEYLLEQIRLTYDQITVLKQDM